MCIICVAPAAMQDHEVILAAAKQDPRAIRHAGKARIGDFSALPSGKRLHNYNVRPPRYLSWCITPILWFKVLITIVTGAYKPSYNWGASHCTIVSPISL